MTGSKANVNSWFVETYKPELYKLLNDLSKDEEKTVVAVARKGPRVLEVIQKVWPEKGSLLLKRVISDKAIPFSAECLRNNNFIIFDDILIYGSTFIDVYKAVNYVSGNGKASNKSLPGLILAFDNKTEKVKVKELDLEKLPSIRRMEPNEITGFSAQIVEAFYYLGKPFDLEHPIIKLPLKIYIEEDIEKILSESNLNFCNLTSSLQRSLGMLYFTVDIPRNFWLAWEKIIDNGTIEVESIKGRLYFNLANKIVRFMPLVLFSTNTNEVESLQFKGEFKSFNDLIKEGQNRVSGTQDQKDEAILRLINFLLAYIEGRYLLHFSPLKYLFDDSNLNSMINSFDLQILFGFDFGNYLYEKLSNNSTFFPDKYIVSPIEKSIAYDQITEVSESLLAKIKSLLKIERLKEKYPFVDEPYSALKAIVDAMRIMDRETRKGEYEPDRLKFGFSFNDLLCIIKNEFDIICDPFSISVALDYYIDRGVIIPIFIKDEENNKWYRVFRFGESKNDKKATFMIVKLLIAAINRLKRRMRITEFEKSLVLLHNVFNIKTELGYEVYDDLRGRRPFYVSKPPNNKPPKLLELSKWASKEEIIKIEGDGDEKEVYIHPDFGRGHSPEDNPWTDPEIVFVIDSVINFALDALSLELKGIYKQELLLALTTCYNQDVTLQAINDELYSWFEDPDIRRTNFRRIINDFKTYSGYIEKGSDLKELQKQLGKVDEHLSQAVVKRKTFEKLNLIKDTLDKTYATSNEDSVKALLAPTYIGKIRGNFNPNIQNNEAWKDINTLLELCNTLTSIARTFLSEKELAYGDKDRKLSIEVEKYNKIAKEYNNQENINFRFTIIEEEYSQKLANPDLKISFNSFVDILDILYKNLYDFYSNKVKNILGSDAKSIKDIDISKLVAETDIQEEVLKKVLEIAYEISREGREGNEIGTAFVVGDADNVLRFSKPLILNPLEGHKDEKKLIKDIKETIKGLAQIDGAFIIRGHGVVQAAGMMVGVGVQQNQIKVDIEKGLGTRHESVATVTSVTKAIGVVVSQSGGIVRVFKNGKKTIELRPK